MLLLLNINHDTSKQILESEAVSWRFESSLEGALLKVLHWGRITHFAHRLLGGGG